jgi:hypothetical protein
MGDDGHTLTRDLGSSILVHYVQHDRTSSSSLHWMLDRAATFSDSVGNQTRSSTAQVRSVVNSKISREPVGASGFEVAPRLGRKEQPVPPLVVSKGLISLCRTQELLQSRKP